MYWASLGLLFAMTVPYVALLSEVCVVAAHLTTEGWPTTAGAWVRLSVSAVLALVSAAGAVVCGLTSGLSGLFIMAALAAVLLRWIDRIVGRFRRQVKAVGDVRTMWLAVLCLCAMATVAAYVVSDRQSRAVVDPLEPLTEEETTASCEDVT